MKWLIGIIVLVLAGAAGWFLLSPLFIDRSVDEPFAYTEADGRINLAAVRAMPQAQQQAMRHDIMATAAAAPDRGAQEDMPAPSTAATVLKVGVFEDADDIHEGRGAATIYALADGRQLLRFESFRTTNGPALVVYLSKHKAPTSADDVTSSGFVSLGALKGNVGNQNYDIPPQLNLEEYHSVVIWCELFGVLFSPARLAAVS